MRQGYAPFGSVVTRSKKQKKVVDDPGPGSYDISLPIINPIVQTIRKKNNNVIVKLGHLGTASFQNDQDRFKTKLLPDLGPGQYSPQKPPEQRQKLKSKNRTVAVEKIRQVIKKQPQRTPAISQVKHLQIGEYVDMPEGLAKQTQKQSPGKVKGSIWSRMTEERGKEMKVRSVSNIGPGEYDWNQKIENQKYPSSSFKSESIRSFFDQIYFETNQEKLAKERLEGHYKSKKVGPGKYNLSDERKQFHKYQFFGSTEQRKLL